MKAKRKYLLLLIPFIFELFICNANFWIFNLLYQESENSLISSEFHVIGMEQEQQGGNTFCIKDSESGKHYIEFTNIDRNVNSIYLDMELEGAEYFGCDIYVKDDGDSEYYHIPSDNSKYIIVPSVQESKWFQTYFYGKLQDIRIELDASQIKVNDHLVLTEVSINKPKAFHFSILRVIGIGLLTALVVIYRRRSNFYNVSFADHNNGHKIYVPVIILINCLLFIFMIKTVHPFTDQHLVKGANHEEYQKLAVAISKGQVYLDDKVPNWLMEMENPYNLSERKKFVNETGQGYLWDNAYYNGHYYVYFGIVPVLLFYLPYYLIFHAALPNYIPILLSWIIISIASARLIGTIIRKWFPQFPYSLYLLLALIFPAVIGSVPVLQRPTIYEVPISMGLMFAILGLDLWLESVQDGEIISVPKIAAGSTCIALIAGCRPNMLLVFLFSFLIFGKFIIRDKKICIQKYWKAATLFIVPFVIIGAGLMYYNWVRFDSVFEFGANYNLTVDDLTKRGFHFSRVGLGLFEMLWKPFTISTKFPFIKLQGADSAYMGKTTVWSNVGGILFVCPFFLFSIIAILVNKGLKKYKQQMRFLVLSVLIAITITILTTNVAGICPRYKADFSFLFAFASVLGICMIHDILKTRNGHPAVLSSFQWVVFLLCLASLFINFLSFFATVEFALWQHNPRCFYTMKYIFEIWK